MRRSAVAFGLWALFGIFVAPAAAMADLPGPRDECEVPETGCEQCWQHYGNGESEQAAYSQCASAAAAKGLKEACRHRQGAGDAVFFCPEGASVPKVTKDVGGGGCAGCSVGSAGGWGGVAALGAAVGLAAWRRRRARK